MSIRSLSFSIASPGAAPSCASGAGHGSALESRRRAERPAMPPETRSKDRHVPFDVVARAWTPPSVFGEVLDALRQRPAWWRIVVAVPLLVVALPLAAVRAATARVERVRARRSRPSLPKRNYTLF